MTSTRPALRQDAVLLLVYLFLALVLTYPLAAHLDTHVPGQGVDDPAQTWSLWWTKFALLTLGASPLATDYIFYPVGLNLVAYTPTFLNGVLSIPLQSVASVIVAANALVCFAFVASGYGTYLLAREVLARAGVAESHRTLAAGIAGAFFAFGAWHVHYADATYMLLSNQWLPFYTLYLLRLDRRPWRNGALAGVFLVLSAWTELTFVLFLAILTAAYLVLRALAWALGVYLSKRAGHAQKGIASSRRALLAMTRGGVIARVIASVFREAIPNRVERNLQDPKGLTDPSGLAALKAPQPSRGFGPQDPKGLADPWGLHAVLNLAALSAVALVGTSPLAYSLIADMQRYGYYLAAGLGRVQVFSAELISFFVPSAQHPLLGAWASGITNANTRYAFVGLAALVLAVLGAKSSGRLWAALAIFFALLMLGPTLVVGGESTGIPMPFAALRAIPFMNANRYPVRFNVMLMLALGPLFALGAARLLQMRRGRVALGALAAVLAFEQLVLPIPLSDLRVPTIYQTIRDEPGDFAVLELPLGWRGSMSLQGKMEDKAQFYQTVHHKRLLGGITSRTPPFKFQYFLEAPVINSLIALEQGREVDAARRAQDRAAALDVLRFFDIRFVDIHRALAGPAVLEYVLDVLPLQEVYRDAARTLYRVNLPSSAAGQIDLSAQSARLYFDERWGRAQVGPEGRAYRWAAASEAGLWLPLSSADTSLTLRLRAPAAGQTVGVDVNGQRVAQFAVTNEWADYAVQLPPAVVREGLDQITFSAGTAPLSEDRMGDYAIGDTGVTSPVDIAVTAAGFDAGRFGEIHVAGRNVIPSWRGYHLVAIDPHTGRVDRVESFRTSVDAAESLRLARFVRELPAGEIVAGVGIDEVSQNLEPAAVEALRQLGVESDLRFQFRVGHAFIGVKGAPPGQALERVDGRFPANVAVGANVSGDRIAFALGGIVISR